MEKCSLGALPLTFHNNYFKTTFSLNTSFPMVARTTKTPRDLPVATTAKCCLCLYCSIKLIGIDTWADYIRANLCISQD